MTRIQILEQEVKRLDPASLETFRAWFLRYDSEAWDRQIQRDARSGKLDKLSRKALAAHRRGKTREL